MSHIHKRGYVYIIEELEFVTDWNLRDRIGF